MVNTNGVEDGIVCEFCGTHCYKGAEHNARVEDNARFDDPKPARVEDGISNERKFSHVGECMDCGCSWGIKDSISGCPKCKKPRCHIEVTPFDEYFAAKDRAVLEPSSSSTPTFAYQLAIYLTRNGDDAPHMQAEINRFLYDGKWKVTQGVKS